MRLISQLHDSDRFVTSSSKNFANLGDPTASCSGISLFWLLLEKSALDIHLADLWHTFRWFSRCIAPTFGC